jgi:protein SCO1/2
MLDPRGGVDPNRLLLAALIGLAIFLVAGAVLGHARSGERPLDPREAVATSQAAIGTRIGDYTLTASDGTVVRLANYRGKPLLVSFIYTACTQVCPATTQFLGRAVAEARRTLGPDAFRVITVGFNPPFDSPSALREFRNRQGIDAANWAFLAADEPTIEGLTRDLGFVFAASAGGFDHVTQVTLIDASGRVSRHVYGESFELPMLIAPLKEEVTGAAAPSQSLADVVDRVRILCTVYDPRAGTYRLNYGLFIEIFAGLSILGATAWYLGAGIRAARRRDAHRFPPASA